MTFSVFRILSKDANEGGEGGYASSYAIPVFPPDIPEEGFLLDEVGLFEGVFFCCFLTSHHVFCLPGKLM